MLFSFFGGRIDLNSKGIVVYKATKLSNLHMLIMNPSEKWSKYPCWRPPACEFVEPVAQDLRVGALEGSTGNPEGITKFNYQKIEELRQNWKVVIYFLQDIPWNNSAVANRKEWHLPHPPDLSTKTWAFSLGKQRRWTAVFGRICFKRLQSWDMFQCGYQISLVKHPLLDSLEYLSSSRRFQAKRGGSVGIFWIAWFFRWFLNTKVAADTFPTFRWWNPS